MKILKYKKFINEELNFSFGINQDLPSTGYNSSSDNTVLTDTEDEYDYPKKRDGTRTHGSISHAIKHLLYMDEDFSKKYISGAYRFLVNYQEDGGFLGIINRQGSFFAYDRDAKRKMGLFEILNLFDYINDKYILKEELHEIEEEILMNYIIPIEKRYKQIIENTIDKSEYCTEERIKNKLPIYFDVIQRGQEMRIYVDLLNLFLIVKNNRFDKIVTTYRLTSPIHKKMNDWIFNDENVKNLILKYHL